jgi:hypothetical protein
VAQPIASFLKEKNREEQTKKKSEPIRVLSPQATKQDSSEDSSMEDEPVLAPGVTEKPPLPSKNLNYNNNNIQKKVDLPGRVSFSTNDLFSVDYSDTEDQESTSKSSKTATASNTTSTGTPPTIVYNKSDYQEANAKCEYNSNYFQEPLPTRQSESYFKFSVVGGASSQTNQVIEDYKKEIENLNRRRTMEIQMVATEEILTITPPSNLSADEEEIEEVIEKQKEKTNEDQVFGYEERIDERKFIGGSSYFGNDGNNARNIR